MADPMTPIEVVETYFKAVRAQDLDLLRSIFADDMVLISINAGHLSGGENIVEFYGKFLEKHGGADPHPGPLMQFGNVVAFEVDAHHGDEVHAVADFFTVEEGQVTRLAIYQGPIRAKA
jgi:aldehyde dehydrogenase (NAD+)